MPRASTRTDAESAEGHSVYTGVASLALRYERQLLSGLREQERKTLDAVVSRLLERARQMA